MGFIDLEDEDNGKRYLQKLEAALGRRGLKPDTSQEWEIHGPHQNMNYQVLIGWAFDDKDNWQLVAVYPRAVYAIDEADKWYQMDSKNRIYCLR